MTRNYKKLAPLLGFVVLIVTAVVLWDRLRTIEFSEIVAQIRSLPLPAVLGALACSIGAYLLVGLYEGIALERVSGQRRPWYALRTTLIANPIGRTVGAALVSGGALRYRFYSAIGLNARQVGALIVLMAMPYLLGVGWLIDISLLLNTDRASKALRLSATTIVAIGTLGVLKDIGWLALAKWREAPIRIAGHEIRIPTLGHTFLQIVLGIAQILCNTGILYLLMPPELDMSWPAFIAIYCIAFLAGQISNVPAGIGVFEAALMLMLPHVPPAKLLGAVLAYRALFEVLPLLVGLVLWAAYEAGRLRQRMVTSGRSNEAAR